MLWLWYKAGVAPDTANKPALVEEILLLKWHDSFFRSSHIVLDRPMPDVRRARRDDAAPKNRPNDKCVVRPSRYPPCNNALLP